MASKMELNEEGEEVGEEETAISVETAAAAAAMTTSAEVVAVPNQLLALPPKSNHSSAQNDSDSSDRHHNQRNPHLYLSDWKLQYTKLNEKWINDSSGKQSGIFLCVCRHCQGQKIPFTGRYCRNHLKVCPVYQLQMASATPMLLSSSHGAATPISTGGNSNNNDGNNKRKAAVVTTLAPLPSPLSSKRAAKPKRAVALTTTPDAARVQQKVIETLAMAHRLPDEPSRLVDLCKVLRPDFVISGGSSSSSLSLVVASPPPQLQQLLPIMIAHRAKLARTNLTTQLQASIASGHVCGCCVRPVDRPWSVVVAGPAVLLEPWTVTTTTSLVADKDGLPVARRVEALVMKLRHNRHGNNNGDNNSNNTCVSFVTMPESRARRILAARHPHLVWIPCLERHLTLLVRDSILECHLQERLSLISSNDAVAVVDNTRGLYGRYVPTAPLNATDWGSLQPWLASRLRIRSAYSHHDNDDDGRSGRDPPAKYWEDLATLERTLRQLCLAKFYLEDHPSLASALLVLLFLYHGLTLSLQSDLGRTIAGRLEQLWSTLEQPLFFLAFAMHPEHGQTAQRILDQSLRDHGSWRTQKNALTVYRLLQAARFYHAKFQLPGSADTLVADLQLWLNHDLPKLAMIEYRPSSGDDPVAYWLRHKAETPELATFAVLLIGTRAHSQPVPVSSSMNQTYHNSLIELDVLQQQQQHRSASVHATRPTRRTVISPQELPRATPPPGTSNADPHDNANTPFDDIVHGDSFDRLWMNMTSIFDGREKEVPTTTRPGGANHDDLEEEGPEMRVDYLDPLPEFDPTGATREENLAYFGTKVYCRNDKYPLARLVVPGMLAFPRGLTIDDDGEYKK